jgi:hypothetical protein
MLEGGSSGVSGPSPSNAADRSSYSSSSHGGGASRSGSVSGSSGKKGGASEAKDFDAEVSKAKADDAPSYREAENASMDAYNEYKGTQRDKEARAELGASLSEAGVGLDGTSRSSDATGGFAGGSSSRGSAASKGDYNSGPGAAASAADRSGSDGSDRSPSYREAENASMEAYDTYQARQRETEAHRELAAGLGAAGAGLDGKSRSSSTKGPPSSPSHRESEIASMEAYDGLRNDRKVADAYAEYARSRLAAGLPVERSQRAAPSYRQTEIASMKALQAREMALAIDRLGNVAFAIAGSLTAIANQYGLNTAANILSRAAPLHTGTVARLTFSTGSIVQRLGASLRAAGIPGIEALGRSLGYFGLTNPNIASTAAVKDVRAWNFSTQARSTQALLAAERWRGVLNVASKMTFWGTLGLEIGFHAYASSLSGVTRKDMITNAIIGGLKATDNGLASLGGGALGGIGGFALGGIFSAPALGTWAVPGAVAGGLLGANGLDLAYRDTALDQTVDGFVENRRGFVSDYVSPEVELALDWIEDNRDWLGAMFGAPGVVSGDWKSERRQRAAEFGAWAGRRGGSR